MEALIFEGRAFELITGSTVLRDITLGNLLDSSGVKEAVLNNLDNEDAMNAAIAVALTKTGNLFEIMGCSLVPQGVSGLTWTFAMKDETRAFFERLPGEKNTQRVLVAAVSLV